MDGVGNRVVVTEMIGRPGVLASGEASLEESNRLVPETERGAVRGNRRAFRVALPLVVKQHDFGSGEPTTGATASAASAPDEQIISYQYDPLYRLTGAGYSGAISATYQYEYDAVGNVTTYTETVTDLNPPPDADPGSETTVTRVSRNFDAANQLLTSVDSREGTTSFFYDGNGNLTLIYPPGASGQDEVGAIRYAFDQRNLLLSRETYSDQDGDGWVAQVAYRYGGDGHRLQQLNHMAGVTTTYHNDNTGLSQVLVADDGATQTTNLFGRDLIHQDDGADTRTLLADGLGSARTEMVGDTIETTTTYEPYGKLLAQNGASGTTYGYTGEQHDGATGLVYLRARYYDPSLKVFLSRDPFPGYVGLPGSQHGYSYSYNNPANHTDPSGLDPWGCATPECHNSDPRDLTLWLYREMKANVNDPVVNSLRTKNLVGKGGMVVSAGAFALGCWADGPLPFVEIGSGIVFIGSGLVYGNVLLQFRDQVKNGARWDFKDEIGLKIGPGLTLCTSGICDSEIEYSVPGNIFFGYIGRASGFTGLELQAGAGWAEWRDPAHDPSSTEYAGPYKGEVDIGRRRPKLWNLGDEPTDHEAVTLGILLWDRYGATVTLAQFKTILSSSITRLGHHSPRSRPVEAEVARKWPYPVGYFNNRGRVFVP